MEVEKKITELGSAYHVQYNQIKKREKKICHQRNFKTFSLNLLRDTNNCQVKILIKKF